MKRGVAPFLAAGAAAGVLHPRDQLGVLPNGQLCPQPTCTNTVIVAPAYYSEYFPYTAVIDPFRNQVPFTVSNAPTTVILTTEVPQAVISCGTETVPVNPTSSTTASTTTSPIAGGSGTASVSSVSISASSVSGISSVSGSSTASSASSTVTTPPGLFVGAGVPAGQAGDFADFIVVAYENLDAPPPAKRQEVKRQAVDGSNPVAVVDFATNDAPNTFGVAPTDCDSATPLLLAGGLLINGASAIAKPNLARQAVFGFLVDNMSTPVNATIVLNEGILTWSAADGVGNADWYSCPDGLWAAFPTLDPARMARCTRVRVGAIAGAACSSYIQQFRPVNTRFTRPQNLVQAPTSSSSVSTTMATVSTSAVTVSTSSTSDVSVSATSASSESSVSTSTVSLSSVSSSDMSSMSSSSDVSSESSESSSSASITSESSSSASITSAASESSQSSSDVSSSESSSASSTSSGI